jgi:hypothetical protein
MADLGVGLNDLALVRGQGAGLEQHAAGDRDLADVVQRAGVLDQPAVLSVQSGPSRDSCRESADARDVSARVLVAELDGSGEPRDDLDLCRLALQKGMLQLAGSLADADLQPFTRGSHRLLGPARTMRPASVSPPTRSPRIWLPGPAHP